MNNYVYVLILKLFVYFMDFQSPSHLSIYISLSSDEITLTTVAHNEKI